MDSQEELAGSELLEEGAPAPTPRRRSRRWLAIPALLLVAAVLAGGVASWRVLGSPPPSQWADVARWSVDPGSYVFRGRPGLNLLLLGIDYNRTREGLPFSRGARSDTLVVLNVDHLGSGLRLLSLPRDTRAEIPGQEGLDKLNAA